MLSVDIPVNKMKKMTTGMTNGKCQFPDAGISSSLGTYILLCSGRDFRY